MSRRRREEGADVAFRGVDTAESPERYRTTTRIFLEVCELGPEERRAALDRACGGDGELRATVETLLRFHDVDRRPPERPGGN